MSNLEGKKIVDQSFTMAAFLVANPNTVVRVFERGAYSYFEYDGNTGKFYFTRPANKHRKGRYEARGLKQSFDKGINDLFARKPLTLQDDEGELPF